MEYEQCCLCKADKEKKEVEAVIFGSVCSKSHQACEEVETSVMEEKVTMLVADLK